ncbi:hypothetical protein [uncultured Sphingomonas sp.]|uniref:hypothetical protein n=1 Tax=uncultured Sphingomonas sp. TaxID=158754 RepID=UPI0025DEC2A3|nr:hypothetical protein [uncultured Sphingomonas sp.]
MKYNDISRTAGAKSFPAQRIVRPAVPVRPRATLLFWLAIAILPWLVIAAILLAGD